jgi:hypothetical protein
VDLRQILLILVFLIFSSGCKRLDPNPELKDPIFGDLVRNLEDQTREKESVSKELETARKDLEAADIQNGESKVRRQAVFDLQQKLDQVKQKYRFAELEVARRTEFARKSYQKAFDKGQEWPDPAEYQSFLANKRLVSAPKSYDETHKMRLEENKSRKPAATTTKAE